MPEFQGPEVQLGAIAPEAALAVTALILLVVNALIPKDAGNRIHLPVLSLLGLAAATSFAVAAWGDTELHLAGAVVQDGFSVFVKLVLIAFGVLTVLLSRDYLRKEGSEEGEFYALVLFAVAGMMLMASSADLIMIFIALETFSLALYVLVGYRWRSLASQEASMKYFLLGAFSSSFLLLGIALVYGAVGTTNLYPTDGSQSVATFLTSTPASEFGLLVLGAGLIVVGLGFKVAAVPFHMWTPDAYQGAPSPVTGFMAAGSKIAGFAALLRVFDATLFPLREDWRPLLIAIAVATMVVGSVLAVVQEDLKRLLAYSSIAHAGFVLTGIVAATDDGVSASLFYLATYGLTVLGAFAVIAVVSGRDESRVRLVDYKGLFFESPLLAATLTLFMLSLAGVPITVGFIGKLVLFSAAVDAGYAWLVVVGALSSAVAAFFYLRVMVVMYMQEPDTPQPPVKTGPLSAAVIGVTALATLGLGLVWGPLIDFAEKATFFAGS